MEGNRMEAVIPATGIDGTTFTKWFYEQLVAVNMEKSTSLVVNVKRVCQMSEEGGETGDSAYELTCSYEKTEDLQQALCLLIDKLAKKMDVHGIRIDFYETTFVIIN